MSDTQPRGQSRRDADDASLVDGPELRSLRNDCRLLERAAVRAR